MSTHHDWLLCCVTPTKACHDPHCQKLCSDRDKPEDLRDRVRRQWNHDDCAVWIVVHKSVAEPAQHVEWLYVLHQKYCAEACTQTVAPCRACARFVFEPPGSKGLWWPYHMVRPGPMGANGHICQLSCPVWATGPSIHPANGGIFGGNCCHQLHRLGKSKSAMALACSLRSMVGAKQYATALLAGNWLRACFNWLNGTPGAQCHGLSLKDSGWCKRIGFHVSWTNRHIISCEVTGSASPPVGVRNWIRVRLFLGVMRSINRCKRHKS